MALMMFPSLLKQELTRSEAFRASWIFFACPIDRVKIARASKNVMVAFFLLPYLALVTVVVAWFAGSFAHVAVHMALLRLVSHLVLQVGILMDPALPFSRPPAVKGQRTTAFFWFMIGVAIVTSILQSFSAAWYSSLPATLAAFAAVVLLSIGIDRLTRARVERDTGRSSSRGSRGSRREEIRNEELSGGWQNRHG